MSSVPSPATSLRSALAATAHSPVLEIPQDLAQQVLDPEDHVLLALPSAPDDSPELMLITQQEAITVRWSRARAARVRETPLAAVRAVRVFHGMAGTVEIEADGARTQALHPCTLEDGIQFVHRLDGLLRTGRLPAPLTEQQLVSAALSRDDYGSGDPSELSMLLWDRAVRRNWLWARADVAYGNHAISGCLEPDERTHLVLMDVPTDSVELIAVTDRRVFGARAPFWKARSFHPSQVTGAHITSGMFGMGRKVEIETTDGASLSVGVAADEVAQEFVSAFDHLMRTGSLPPHLAIVPQTRN